MPKEQHPKKAVGLSYRAEEHPVPRVLAKGEGVVAEDIIQRARSHGIPITENKGLVDTLLKLDYMQDIPEDLYELVAEILAYAFEITGGSPFQETMQGSPPTGDVSEQ